MSNATSCTGPPPTRVTDAGGSDPQNVTRCLFCINAVILGDLQHEPNEVALNRNKLLFNLCHHLHLDAKQLPQKMTRAKFPFCDNCETLLNQLLFLQEEMDKLKLKIQRVVVDRKILEKEPKNDPLESSKFGKLYEMILDAEVEKPPYFGRATSSSQEPVGEESFRSQFLDPLAHPVEGEVDNFSSNAMEVQEEDFEDDVPTNSINGVDGDVDDQEEDPEWAALNARAARLLGKTNSVSDASKNIKKRKRLADTMTSSTTSTIESRKNIRHATENDNGVGAVKQVKHQVCGRLMNSRRSLGNHMRIRKFGKEYIPSATRAAPEELAAQTERIARWAREPRQQHSYNLRSMKVEVEEYESKTDSDVICFE
ncbi:hypothetical protein Ocin01_13842 [Orchesella cincta]|uniref:Uncharacterized protein n=1 Tax=Orchesella cincta TaxID=48709 RepID=A0A1D2MIU8_ORCCI|nr:hypothetical protein Ocin01_13842 [Orchesella cincta]